MSDTRLQIIRDKRKHYTTPDEHYMGCGRSTYCPGPITDDDVYYLLDHISMLEAELANERETIRKAYNAYADEFEKNAKLRAELKRMEKFNEGNNPN